MTTNTVFKEQFGHLSRAQWAAYRTYNITPAEHYALIELWFDESDHAFITDYVKWNVAENGSGMYRESDELVYKFERIRGGYAY